MRNLLVAQSGGPTSAINATIAGVIMEAHASDQVDTIYGAVNGIKGVLEERFVNLSEKYPARMNWRFFVRHRQQHWVPAG